MKKVSKIIQKVVASMIVFVMTMAQCAIVGFSAISYAVDMIATNSDNVQFKAYFETEEGEVTEIAKSIEEANLKLKIDVAVQNEGYLSNGQISLQNAGFKIKEEQAQNEYVEKIENGIIYLKQINAEEEANIQINIESNKDAEIRAESLHQESIVNLAGTYYHSKGNTQINGQNRVKIDWLLPQDVKAELATKLITNSTYKVQEENKKIVQFLISNRLTGNRYPIKATQIEATIPEGATNVEVHKRTTKATNGDKDFTTANYSVEKNEQTGENRERDANNQVGENKLKINVENTETNGNISWSKNTPDIYVVTYEFSETKDLTTEQIMVNSKITAYDSKQTILKGETQQIALNEEAQQITSIDQKEQEAEIYKGKIYTGEERNYTTYTRIYVDYAKAIDEIKIKEKASKFIINEQTQETEAQPTEKEANIQYKEIKLNKQEIEKILGTEWEINIKDQNNKQINLTNLSVNEIIQNNQAQTNEQTINNQTEEEQIKVDENGIITVKLEAGAKALEITTSKPQNNGVITIQKIKAIQKTNYTREEIKELTGIKENSEVTVTKEDNKTEKQAKETSIKLLETETKATLSLSRNNFTTVSTNENIEITAKLNTNGENLNLYKNPEVDIVFPKEISKVQVTNAKALYKNGLEIESNKIHQTEDGRKALYIKLKGEQTTYDANGGVELHLYVDIDTDNTITEDKTAPIEMNYTNENDGTEKVEKQNIEIQYIEKQAANTNQQTNTPVTRALRAPALRATGTENTQENENNENTSAGETNNTQEVTIVEGLKAQIVATRGEQTLQEGDSIYEGETIRYTITITNNTGVDIENINLKSTQTNGKVWKLVETEVYNPHYDETRMEHMYKISDTNEYNFDKIEKISNEESVVLKYEAQANNYQNENMTTYGTIEITTEDNVINKTIKTIETKIEKADIKMEFFEVESREDEFTTNGAAKTQLDITNLKDTEINEITVKVTMSNNLICEDDKDYIYFDDIEGAQVTLINNDTDSKGNVIITLKINNFEPNKKIEINFIPIIADTNKNEVIQMMAKAEMGTGKEYYSNILEREAENSTFDVQVEQEAYMYGEKLDENALISNDEEFEIQVKIINNDTRDVYMSVSDVFEMGVTILDAELEYDQTDIKSIQNAEYTVSSIFELKAKTTAILRVKAIVNINLLKSSEFKSKVNAKIQLLGQKNLTNVLTLQTYKNTSSEEDEDNNGSNNGGSTTLYNIKGKAWIDNNKDGKRDTNEKMLSGINVIAIDENTSIIAQKQTQTDANGEYTIQLEKGKYSLVFLYDTNQYNLTVYQARGINDDINSDVVASKIEIDGRELTVGKTDDINVSSNISNIDIGLIKKEKFDLKIQKYVSKVTVTNKGGSEIKTFTKDIDIPKVEIRGKYLNGSLVLIEYTIKITNNGDIAGYATSILDKIPSGLKYQSSLNKDWYAKGNNLYNQSLKSIKIEPGETKDVKLILTKSMTESNTGLFKNTVNIEKSKNEYALEDIDIDNDTDSAEMIITISTGETATYMAISLAIAIIVSTGIGITIKKYYTRKQ